VSGLVVETAERSETWTLARPEVRNALDPALVTALIDALDAAEARGAEVVVLRGAGRGFCAGADLRHLESHDARGMVTPREFLTRVWDLTVRLEQSAVVVVAALHGHAVAGGLELALACDVVLAAEGTRIGDGHVLRDLLPGGGASVRLERALGRGPSAWLALTGELLPAEDRAFAGWLRHVVPLSELEATTRHVVDTLLAAPHAARSEYKQLLAAARPPLGPADREIELDAFDRHWVEHDVPATLRRYLDRSEEAR
jgi:enoyl-CoA hydratase/carnithine racemase